MLAQNTISPWFCGSKFALFHNFAGQKTKFPWFCGAKNKHSVILRDKSRLLYNFAGWNLHHFVILRGEEKVLGAKIQKRMNFNFFFEIYGVNWLLIQRSIFIKVFVEQFLALPWSTNKCYILSKKMKYDKNYADVIWKF